MSWLDEIKGRAALDGRWFHVQQALRMRAGDLKRTADNMEQLVWQQLDGLDTLDELRESYRSLKLLAGRLGSLSASIRAAHEAGGTLRQFGDARKIPLPPPPELSLEIPLINYRWREELPPVQ